MTNPPDGPWSTPPAQPGQPPGYQPGYQPGYPPPPYGQPSGYGPRPPSNGKAQAALWTGIGTLLFSLCCGFGVLGIVPVVLGVMARREIRASGGVQGGDGPALAGIVTGAIAIVIGLASLAFLVIAVIAGGGVSVDGYSQTRV